MVTLECVEKLIRKDMVDPVNGEKLTDRDIIVLQRVSPAAPSAPCAGTPPSSRGPAHSPGPRPASPPAPGRHRLRGLGREAAGGEVQARDAGLMRRPPGTK